MWMNSLNLSEGALTINRLLDDLQDGVALIETGLAIAGDEVAAIMGTRKLNRGTPERPLNKCVARAQTRPVCRRPTNVAYIRVSISPACSPIATFPRNPRHFSPSPPAGSSALRTATWRWRWARSWGSP